MSEPSEPPEIASAGTPSDITVAVEPDSIVHLLPGTLVGEYEIEKLLGSGAMGQVYGGRHEKLGKKVAIKVIAANLSTDREAVERFEQEAQALARLSHPNIVDVLTFGTLPDGRSYFAMEWLNGESLYDRIERGPVSFDEALEILDQIARGLEAAHAAGIIHRDIKPGNIWLHEIGEQYPVVKILDFGLSKLTGHRRSEETVVNAMFGTAYYVSPEQCRSARDVGPETDVYSLGCLAYELICGRLPFVYDNLAELVTAHQTEAPPTPSSITSRVSPAMDAFLNAMLRKEPHRRPSLAQIRAFLAQSRRAQTIEPVERVHDRRLILMGIVCVGLAAITAVIGSHALSPASTNTSADARKVDAMVEVETIPQDAVTMPATVPTEPAKVKLSKPEVHKPVAAPSAPKQVTVPEPAPAASAAPEPAPATSAVQEPVSPPPKPKVNERDATVNPFAHHRKNP